MRKLVNSILILHVFLDPFFYVFILVDFPVPNLIPVQGYAIEK
jgi:hypothetical protein